MKMQLKLYLANAMGKMRTLTINNPKPDLKETDISSVEAKLVNSGAVVVADEPLTGIEKAVYIQTSETQIK